MRNENEVRKALGLPLEPITLDSPGWEKEGDRLVYRPFPDLYAEDGVAHQRNRAEVFDLMRPSETPVEGSDEDDRTIEALFPVTFPYLPPIEPFRIAKTNGHPRYIVTPWGTACDVNGGPIFPLRRRTASQKREEAGRWWH